MVSIHRYRQGRDYSMNQAEVITLLALPESSLNLVFSRKLRSVPKSSPWLELKEAEVAVKSARST
jgi:hypothetical protein